MDTFAPTESLEESYFYFCVQCALDDQDYPDFDLWLTLTNFGEGWISK